MRSRWLWARRHRRLPGESAETADSRTGSPDTTRQRGREARSTANAGPQDSHCDASPPEPCCRQPSGGRTSWPLVLANLGVFMGGLGQVLPDDARQQLLEVLIKLLT